jgi:hypothetical protein
VSGLAKKNSLGPVVVFPEGTTTNGRGLIKFLPVLDKGGFQLKKDVSGNSGKGGLPKFHIFGLRYDYDEYSPTYTIGGKMSHLIGLGAQFANFLEVRKLAPEESNSIVNPSSTSDGGMGGQASSLLGQLVRLRMTSLSAPDKIEFFDFYKEREGKKRK